MADLQNIGVDETGRNSNPLINSAIDQVNKNKHEANRLNVVIDGIGSNVRDLQLHANSTDGMIFDNILPSITRLQREKEDVVNKGVAGGYAPLDQNGKVPFAHINAPIIGSLFHGGEFDPTTGIATLTNNAMTVLGASVPSFELPASPDDNMQLMFFVAKTGGTFQGITINAGDWLVANAGGWDSIANEATENFGSVTAGSGTDTTTDAQTNIGIWAMFQLVWDRISAMFGRLNNSFNGGDFLTYVRSRATESGFYVVSSNFTTNGATATTATYYVNNRSESDIFVLAMVNNRIFTARIRETTETVEWSNQSLQLDTISATISDDIFQIAQSLENRASFITGGNPTNSPLNNSEFAFIAQGGGQWINLLACSRTGGALAGRLFGCVRQLGVWGSWSEFQRNLSVGASLALEIDLSESLECVQEQIIYKRDCILRATDKYTISDYPIEQPDLDEVKNYRQALRDLPEQAGFETGDVEFPEVPTFLLNESATE